MAARCCEPERSAFSGRGSHTQMESSVAEVRTAALRLPLNDKGRQERIEGHDEECECSGGVESISTTRLSSGGAILG